jgi:hypothetical protein
MILRSTLAAALTMLALPARADEPSTCSVCGDPTWPTLEAPAPATPLGGSAREAGVARGLDETWPETALAAPAMVLAVETAEPVPLDPMAVTRDESHALVLGAAADHVASATVSDRREEARARRPRDARARALAAPRGPR